MVKNDFLLRISIVGLQLRWRRRKNPQRISVDTPPVFSSSPPRFVKTLKMFTTEPFFTTLLKIALKRRELRVFLPQSLVQIAPRKAPMERVVTWKDCPIARGDHGRLLGVSGLRYIAPFSDQTAQRASL